MKRDMEVIRKIILAVKSSEEQVQSVEGVPDDKFNYHTMLLKEAGLIKGTVSASKNQNIIPNIALITDLTWDGHDFADSIGDDTVWNTAKGRIQEVGSWTFDLFLECVKQEAKKRIGLQFSS